MARDHIVHARLTSNEEAVLRAAARLAGETLSEALRRPALRWAREIIAGGENTTRGECPAEEARRLLDSFEATLEAGGMTMDDLIRVQVFCSDVSLYEMFNAQYRTRFTGPFPARAFIGSGQLLFGCRFEMLGTAAHR